MTKKAHFDVLVIGTPCVDLVFGGMPHWPILGKEMYVDKFCVSAGAVFNSAATLSRLGLRVALLTELGNDFFSRFILEEIEKAGISRELVLVHDQALFSVSICLAHDNERGFVSYSTIRDEILSRRQDIHSSANGNRTAEEGGVEFARYDPQSLLNGYEFDAVLSYARLANLSLINFLAERGATLFFDTGWDSRELSDPRLISVLKWGDYLMPNQLEATFITGTETAEAAARALATLVPTATTIVKMGAQGAVACQDETLTYCGAHPIAAVVDTTGAGDAFNGGFIYGILKGYSLAEALHCGTICGSLSTTALTGTAAVPTVEELERLLDRA